jgi:hypothetical protein
MTFKGDSLSLSLSLSLRFLLFCVCVCVCWLPRSSNHQFLSSAAIYSFTVFLVSPSSLMVFATDFPLYSSTFMQECEDCGERSQQLDYLLPLHPHFVSDELRICLLLQSHCTLVFYNYNLCSCQQYLIICVVVNNTCAFLFLFQRNILEKFSCLYCKTNI